MGLPELLLARSASVTGFFLLHYTRLFRAHLGRLGRLLNTGRLQVHLDSTRFRLDPQTIRADCDMQNDFKSSQSTHDCRFKRNCINFHTCLGLRLQFML